MNSDDVAPIRSAAIIAEKGAAIAPVHSKMSDEILEARNRPGPRTGHDPGRRQDTPSAPAPVNDRAAQTRSLRPQASTIHDRSL